jgi:hypothetical protein
MSKDRKDKDLQQELERLGEPAADVEEIAAAERLAARLEGALHVAGPTEDADLSTLATTLRGDAKDHGIAAADRALASIFGGAEGQAPDEAPADELEQRRAQTLASGVDRMIAGLPPVAAPGDLHDLLLLAGLIRAATHASALSPGRLETLVDQAYGAPAPADAGTPRDQARAQGRTSTLVRLALVAVLSVVVVGAALVMGDSLRREPAPTARQPVPTHLTSRSTRDILPTAFERGQTSTERINLIYHDRMRSFRELHLSQPSRTRRRP